MNITLTNTMRTQNGPDEIYAVTTEDGRRAEVDINAMRAPIWTNGDNLTEDEQIEALARIDATPEISVRQYTDRVEWRCDNEDALVAVSWDTVLTYADRSIRDTIDDHDLLLYRSACESGRGPDVDKGADGWRMIDYRN